MEYTLPQLDSKQLVPTVAYIRDLALVLGSLQRAFLPVDPHDWQHGLTVGMRGLYAQPFSVAGEHVRASLDLVTYRFRLDGTRWLFDEYAGPEVFNNVLSWLEAKGAQAHVEVPEFSAPPRRFEHDQAASYAQALWWFDHQFRQIKDHIKGGLTSPVLLYPHHFDLSLVWFPHNDERQYGLGFSPGDGAINEPYVYLTVYPASDEFAARPLPAGAFWQTKGFSGRVITYEALRSAKNPEQLLRDFCDVMLTG
jgi:hypothetical protein